jgi:hypothetical protein
MSGPHPTTLYPLAGTNRRCFLKNLIKNLNIVVGEYTYYDDFEDVGNFEKIQWWNWSPEKITRHVADLTGKDVNALFKQTFSYPVKPIFLCVPSQKGLF